jgi:hypothetical protein
MVHGKEITTLVRSAACPTEVNNLRIQFGVSVNRLYGFEQFILQSIQSGYGKVTFEREGQPDPLLRRSS